MAGCLHDVCDTELSSGGKRLSHRLLEIVKILNKGAVAKCFTSKLCVCVWPVSGQASKQTNIQRDPSKHALMFVRLKR